MEVATLGSPSLTVLHTVSVDVKLRLRLCRWRFAAEAKAKVKNNFSVGTSSWNCDQRQKYRPAAGTEMDSDCFV